MLVCKILLIECWAEDGLVNKKFIYLTILMLIRSFKDKKLHL